MCIFAQRVPFADDPLAVVDSELRVKGVKGLRVVDASIMPTITSGNTNSPTLMIAEKTAQRIVREWDALGKNAQPVCVPS